MWSWRSEEERGSLSAYLAPRVSRVHVVELDERLRGALERSVAEFDNVSLWWGDAMRVDLSAMRPAPTKIVANLPYGIAAGVLLRTIEELEDVALWLVMVQREVGERLAAAPGSGVYGVSSVLAQLAGEVKVVRAIPRTVFRPVPNVDSVLVKIVRTAAAPTPAVRKLVGGCLRAPAQGAGEIARALRDAPHARGHPRGAGRARPPSRRARRAPGAGGVRRAGEGAGPVNGSPLALPLRALAPAKINLGLFVGPTRPDGRHELASVMQSISLADELVLQAAPPGAEHDEVVCAGVAGENLAARALELFRAATGWDAAPLRLQIDKRIPIAAGSRRGLRGCGGDVAPGHSCLGAGGFGFVVRARCRAGRRRPRAGDARTLAGDRRR